MVCGWCSHWRGVGWDQSAQPQMKLKKLPDFLIAQMETNQECFACGVLAAWPLQAGTKEEQIANPRMERSKLTVKKFVAEVLKITKN